MSANRGVPPGWGRVDNSLSTAGVAATLDRLCDEFVDAVNTEKEAGTGGVYLTRPVLTAVALAGAARTAAAAIRDTAAAERSAAAEVVSVFDVASVAGDNYRDGHNAGWIACLAAHGLTPDDPDDPATMADVAAVAPVMRMRHPGELAGIAWDAYCASTRGRSPVTGDVLPAWAELADADQDTNHGKVYRAWCAAAQAVVNAIR